MVKEVKVRHTGNETYVVLYRLVKEVKVRHTGNETYVVLYRLL